MNISRYATCLICICVLLSAPAETWCGDYVSDIDSVRSSMIEMGSRLPAAIRKAAPGDIRTLERVFEINNYALMTIESYLKMMKIYTLSGGYKQEEVMRILNNWLSFIISYCAADIRYLEKTAEESQDKTVEDIVNEEKDNIKKLLKAAHKGRGQNIKVFGG